MTGFEGAVVDAPISRSSGVVSQEYGGIPEILETAAKERIVEVVEGRKA